MITRRKVRYVSTTRRDAPLVANRFAAPSVGDMRLRRGEAVGVSAPVAETATVRWGLCGIVKE